MKTINITDENIIRVGRTYFDGEALWCGLSGTGIIFDTDSMEVSITFAGDSNSANPQADNKARVGIMVDGERVCDFIMEDKLILKKLSLGGGTHTIQVIKLSEAPMSIAAISAIEIEDKAIITKSVLPELKIEFVGDSITCGYGIDCEDAMIPFRTGTEDCTGAYAYRTAKALNAQYSLCSFSGYGIVSGYTDKEVPNECELVPPHYTKTGFSYAETNKGEKLQDHMWDFSEYQPNLVVINLGTNDFSYCKDIQERIDTYISKYVDFIKVVREKNPGAKIMLALGLMTTFNFEVVEEVVKTYKQNTSDNELYCVHIPLQLEEDGFTSDFHPTRVSHGKACEVVTKAIRQII